MNCKGPEHFAPGSCHHGEVTIAAVGAAKPGQDGHCGSQALAADAETTPILILRCYAEFVNYPLSLLMVLWLTL
jgi:hypothetical protein